MDKNKPSAVAWVFAVALLMPVALFFGLTGGRSHLVGLAIAIGFILLWSLLEVQMLGRGLVLRREIPSNLVEDGSATVRLSIYNRSVLPLPPAEVNELFLPQIPPRIRAAIFPGLGSGYETDVVYHAFLNASRGNYDVGPLRLVITDPLGLVSRTIVLGKKHRVIVYPRPCSVHRLAPRGGGREYWTGRLSMLKGQSTVFRSLREFQSGDSIRHIHWRSTAKLGKPVVRELEAFETGEVMLLLDLHKFSRFGVGRKGTVEYAVRIASTLARQFLQRGNAVGLFASDRNDLRLPPSRSSGGLQKIQRALAKVRGVGERPLDEVLRKALSFVRGGLLVPILPRQRAEPRRILPPLIHHMRHGGRVVCFLIDTRTFVPIFKEQTRFGGVVTVDLADILRASGADVVAVSGELRMIQLPSLLRGGGR